MRGTPRKRPHNSHNEVDQTPKSKRGRPKKKNLLLTRYPPLRDTADDSVTVSRNILLLQKELQKENPRKEIVLSLSQQTFTKRREDVLLDSEEISATSLLQTYNELHKNYVVRLSICYF